LLYLNFLEQETESPANPDPQGLAMRAVILCSQPCLSLDQIIDRKHAVVRAIDWRFLEESLAPPANRPTAVPRHD
jgi:hypothetical protein